VADTDEKAQELGRHFLWTIEHRMRGPREHNDPPGYQTHAARRVSVRRPPLGDYQQMQDLNIMVIGSPDTVIRKLTDTINRLSPGHLVLIGSDGPLPHKDVLRSVELLGKEVIPALRELKLQPYE